MEKLYDFLPKVNKLNEEMQKAIVDIIDENGGLIRTDNDTDKSTIFGYVYNEEIERYEERKIIALTIFNDKELGVLFGNETLNDMTDDEILESGEWYTIFGGFIFANATLVYICQTLEEHI